MAEKANTTSLTSNSLFPGSDDLGPLSGPFALAPALVPSASTTISSSSNDSITEEIILNKDEAEPEMEKFIEQPITPTTSSYVGDSSPSTSSTSVNVPPHTLYSPMDQPPPSVSYQNSSLSSHTPSQTSRPIHAVPPFTQSQQSMFPPASPHIPSAPPPTPEQRAKASPVRPHWFYLKHGKVWTPFSWKDSNLLQLSYSTSSRGGDRIIATDGGRFDVNIDKRTRTSVYWNEPVTVVRPCTWFCKAHERENKLTPYEESLSAKLEQAFLEAHDEQKWPKTVNLNKGETVIMHNSNVMVHFSGTTSTADDWTDDEIRSRPKVVRRGIDDFESEIDDGEPSQIDHLVFVVHGIGPYADLQFRSLVECVNDFRKLSLEMMEGRRENLIRKQDNLVGRIEFLPVLWHAAIHDDMANGVDRLLQSITINSVSKLREFTNTTLLDILFFTSPVYCQTIVDKVGSEMNRLLRLFRMRNPSFKGNISVCGHSLGSAICFDILQHQGDQHEPGVKKQSKMNTSQACQQRNVQHNVDSSTLPNLEQILQRLGLENFLLTFQMEQIDGEALMMCSEDDLKELSIPMGPRKKIISYQKDYIKEKEVRNLSLENTKVADIDTTETSQVNSSLTNLGVTSPSIEIVEILQYHQGQQGTAGTGQPYVHYPKLDFEPRNMFALGSPIGLFLTVRGVDSVGMDYCLPTCPGFYNIFHPYDPVAYRIEPLVMKGFKGDPVLMPHHKGRKRMHLELRENLSRIGANLKQKFVESVKETWASLNDFARAHTGVQDPDVDNEEPAKTTGDSLNLSNEKCEVGSVSMGRLNRGQRFDLVLQEKPIEILNEYLFALSGHACYWQSEDTALFMLNEIYKN
ncbi:phospholipase DDHD2-like [Xenia sp. Carnegie-2017]|uniref:phospholipase DDHD2-like n=1 Tax=Xenia sp. Carnegie-2017 TaxID=2897299 RepID=UPI001F036DCA|nr:phospholipase DDHD2-like [Xenia sp. Carnegie-2017]